jgi:cytidylate kinase
MDGLNDTTGDVLKHKVNMLFYGMQHIPKRHIITLGGLPGSGKSTIKQLLAERLGYKMFSTGDFVRELAIDRNMTLEEFNDVVFHDKSIDELIDERLTHIETTEDHYIIDSHLAYHFVPSGFSVFLNISKEESARRILNDAQSPKRKKSGETMDTYAEALARTEKRVQNHIGRYLKHYGINPYIPTQYKLILDSEKLDPESVASAIVHAYKKWLDE